MWTRGGKGVSPPGGCTCRPNAEMGMYLLGGVVLDIFMVVQKHFYSGGDKNNYC